jgi:fatty acid desaturase
MTIANGQRPSNLYPALKRQVRDAGLLERAPGFAAWAITRNLLMLALGVTVLFLSDSWWVQLLNAAFLAFVFGQIGFVAHDVGHRQAFATTRRNDWVGLIHTNLLIGMGFGWWLAKHNAHHVNPNEHGADPDIDIPVIAFSREDALERRGFLRFMVAHQALFFFPLLLFEAAHLRGATLAFLLRERTWKYRRSEWICFLAHHALLLGVVFWALPFWTGLTFLLVQQALFGLYLASVFAPNHKGMLVLEADHDLDFLHQQVLTARNVRASRWVDMWYGGLNYQIEHHLFPSMARTRLRSAQRIVKAFCREHGVAYHETSVLESYREILEYLHTVSAPLRQPANPVRAG